MKVNESTAPGIRPRALIVALLLMVPNAYFVVGAEVLWEQGLPTRIALFYSVVFIVFVVTLLNVLLERFLPKAALTRAELLFLYIMLSLSASLSGTDMLQGLIVTMGHPFWFATPENDWKNLFWRYIPKWLAVGDLNILTGFYKGESTLYTEKHITVWISRVLIWAGFTVVLVFTYLCMVSFSAGLVDKRGDSQIRWDQRLSSTEALFSRVDLRRIYDWQHLESHRLRGRLPHV